VVDKGNSGALISAVEELLGAAYPRLFMSRPWRQEGDRKGIELVCWGDSPAGLR
jgi:hypothetical protein